ncbi:MAG: serine protease [Selenomonas sp.]|jgi:membrane-bound serine protease (ClpP class)|nr:serine protease [Selenomonas sp.]MDD6119207.1 NfeD family protein [Selenomonadaceae bacterium]MDD7056877.1 NfeD family protein [Selenomonadaceae bacterium]HBT79058.1 serine protease [Selenomonas sp.]
MDMVTLPVVQTLLLAIMFLALFVEIKTGGMGGGIMLGIVAAGVFWGSRYVEGLVDLYQIAIFLVGILCIIVEMLLPTVGLLAGVGVAALLYSLLLALGGDVDAMTALGAALILAVVIFVLIVKKLPSSRLWHKVVLHDRSTSQRGFVSAETRRELIGREGTVLTELRPAGSVQLGEQVVDVVSEGAFVAKGERVKVIAVNGARVVVRRCAP